MQHQPLTILAVIDQQSQATWVHDLLQRLRTSEQYHLHCMQHANAHSSQATHHRGIAASVVNYIVTRWIDRPRFDPSDHTRAIRPDLLDSKDVPGDIDVILHLSELDSTSCASLPASKNGIWHAHHDAIAKQTMCNLLNRDDTNPLRLWQYNGATGVADAMLLAEHALPLQSFSISDLTSATFASLPALFESRLNWLAQGKVPHDYEHAQKKMLQANVSKTTPNTFNTQALSSVYKALMLLWAYQKKRVTNRLYNEQWQLAFSFNDQGDQNTETIEQYSPIVPPANRMWADPHIIWQHNQCYVYFEDLDFKENKGRISVASLSTSGTMGKPQLALEEAHHLSYPFVFEHDGRHYMIPESSATKKISLYRCNALPDQWEFVEHLIEDIDASDSTLLFHQNTWWLFTSGMSHPLVDERDQLLIWHSDSLLEGTWHAHPMNPVVTGVDRARMAGPFFIENGRLYRPSQYGARRYGYGTNLSQIHTLTTEDYAESLVKWHHPEDQSQWLASHTYTRNASLTVIDRMKLIRKLAYSLFSR